MGEDLLGFGLRVYPTGRKAFVVFYRSGARQRFMTVGQFGVLTVQEARDKARRILVEALDGDPLAKRQKARHGSTLRQLADSYLKEHAIPKKKPRSVAEDRRLLEKVILPALGSRGVADIEREDIARLHHSLRKTPTQANRVLALLSVIMSLAEKWGLRPDNTNPCRHVERFPERRRERYLSEEEIARLGEVLGEASTCLMPLDRRLKRLLGRRSWATAKPA